MRAFQIHVSDNVATALVELVPGEVVVAGDAVRASVVAVEKVPVGHKIAVADIAVGEPVIKYGVAIGRATRAVSRGQWVHLHCMESGYDERSAHLDPGTGVPLDIAYE